MSKRGLGGDGRPDHRRDARRVRGRRVARRRGGRPEPASAIWRDRISFNARDRIDPEMDAVIVADVEAERVTDARSESYGALRRDPSRRAAGRSRSWRSARTAARSGWHTTCHSRCVSTTNRAPRWSGTRISVLGSGRPSGPCSMRIMKLSGKSVSSSHERTTQPSESGLNRLLSSRWIWRASRFVVLRLELDRAHAPEVRADRAHLVHDRGAQRRVRGEPAVLVGARVVFLPEPAAVELAVGGGDGSEVGVAATLPVHVLEREVLRARARRGRGHGARRTRARRARRDAGAGCRAGCRSTSAAPAASGRSSPWIQCTSVCPNSMTPAGEHRSVGRRGQSAS